VSLTRYEILILLKASLTRDEVDQFKEELKQWVESQKGKIVDYRDMGKRSLAYPINHKTDAVYLNIEVELVPGTANEASRLLGLNSKVIRSLVTKQSPFSSSKKLDELSKVKSLKDKPTPAVAAGVNR
jgi:small subunit ribosomal protein S6